MNLSNTEIAMIVLGSILILVAMGLTWYTWKSVKEHSETKWHTKKTKVELRQTSKSSKDFEAYHGLRPATYDKIPHRRH